MLYWVANARFKDLNRSVQWLTSMSFKRLSLSLSQMFSRLVFSSCHRITHVVTRLCTVSLEHEKENFSDEHMWRHACHVSVQPAWVMWLCQFITYSLQLIGYFADYRWRYEVGLWAGSQLLRCHGYFTSTIHHQAVSFAWPRWYWRGLKLWKEKK